MIKKKSVGVTLIELLIVMIIIAILSVVIFISMTGSKFLMLALLHQETTLSGLGLVIIIQPITVLVEFLLL